MNIIETNLSFGSMTKRTKTNRMILHHAAATTCSAEDIHKWHKNNGWAGAGYHFLVRKDGKVYRLRPEQYVGAHASGSNSDSIGICFEGNFDKEQMCTAQINAGKELVAYLKEKYKISKVQRHKDVCSTSCPGASFPFEQISKATSTATGTPATKSTSIAAPSYAVGKTYTTQVELAVRKAPGTSSTKVGFSGLSANAKTHDKDKDGAIDKGTKVTCQGTKKVGNDIWMKIPSGWIAAYYNGKVYVK